VLGSSIVLLQWWYDMMYIAMSSMHADEFEQWQLSYFNAEGMVGMHTCMI